MTPITPMTPDSRAGTLHAYSLFHLNLAFSSIEEELRPKVIEHAYWPLLRLIEDLRVPAGIEATVYTLDAIAAHDPAWIAKLKALIADGLVEFIGSGYAQIIGPLVPAEVNEANLALGHVGYERHLGIRPQTALVNEQAYAAGLVPLYRAAGYTALLMDWDNCAARHPEWDREWRFHPQIANGTGASEITLLWTNTLAFQKMQRLAHGDIELDDYLRFIDGKMGAHPRALAIYGNDAEIFDFRPGRFKTEELLHPDGEWQRLRSAYEALRKRGDITLVLPRDVAAGEKTPHAFHRLDLGTAAYPTPVKKQHKYNLTRWAVSGRDDIAINSRCWQAYEALKRAGDHTSHPGDWRELCYLWASDFRTHITEKRWQAYQARLEAFAARFAPPAEPARAYISSTAPLHRSGKFIDIDTGAVRARLNLKRGLAIESLAFNGDNAVLCRTLPHGYYHDIGMGYDWYSGTAVMERPGASKVTDLVAIEPAISESPDAVHLNAAITTPKGLINKTISLSKEANMVKYSLTFDWEEWGLGSLRLGNFTLNPEVFEADRLTYRTQNGGHDTEEFALAEETVDHGAPVSFLVSASCGLGLTGGWLDIGDTKRRLKIRVDHTASALIGMLTHRRVDDSYFCRVSLSALEMDETRKPSEMSDGPRAFRFSVEAV